LLYAAKGLDLTFHMGFDQITCEYQFDAIEWLVKHRVQRILTQRGLSNTSIENNLVKGIPRLCGWSNHYFARRRNNGQEPKFNRK
jgi:copper homeostasis protein CutC